MAGVMEHHPDLIDDDEDEKTRLAKELERDGIPIPTHVDKPEDVLSDAQAGRVGGVFAVGEKIERAKEEHESDKDKFVNYLEAFTLAATTLIDFRENVKKDMKQSKMTLKESEYAVKYINRCHDLMTKLFRDTDAKRLQAEGASAALDLTIKTIKRVYDDEREKLRRIEEYLEAPGETAHERIKNRPVGLNPGRPLKEMERETEEAAALGSVSKEKSTTKKKNQKKIPKGVSKVP
jgi:hypothetical protein